ncbi:MAG TPA: hypothetical protein VL426_06575 [Candidatus Binatia bacterium]|nr:hypothetical protein [Candidatus Binatia bacterium]
MPVLLVVILALLLPRLTIAILWLLTSWFSGVFFEPILPVLGFLFMPYTLLWYSVVTNFYGGVWSVAPLLGLIIAVMLDISASGLGYTHYHRHYYVVEEDDDEL